MYERLGINFIGAANPRNFEGDPAFGWGFYGHRTNLYRETEPRRGYFMLQDWADEFGQDSFVVSSNVDGQFQKAGYREDQVLEVHGSIAKVAERFKIDRSTVFRKIRKDRAG